MTTTGIDPHLDLLDEARVAAAAEDRAQRRLLAAADVQDATFHGTVEDLAEAGAELVLHTTIGRRIRGFVQALNADHVTVTGDHGVARVRIDAVTVVRVAGGGAPHPGGGERADRAPAPLADAVRHLVDDRASVEVLFDGGGGIRGTALAAGRDILTIRDGHGSRALVHLDRAAVLLSHT